MKRFTETGKWDDSWFIRLHPLRKLFWVYICDRCDASGVLDFVAELCTMHIGAEVTETWFQDFGNRVQKLPNGKWQIIKFLPFQYGTVDARCQAHKPVIRLINSNGLNFPIQNLENLPITLYNRVSDKDKEKKRTLTHMPARGRPENQAEVEAFCVSLGLPPEDGQAMWLHWQEKGWAKVKDWKLTIQKWKSFGYLPSQRHKQPQPNPKQSAPLYDKLPPTREVSDDEFLKHQRIAKEAAEKFRAEQQARLRST